MKKILISLLALMLFITPVAAKEIAVGEVLGEVFYNSEFSDISDHWAEEVIVKYTELGIISGYPDGTFKPDRPITRAELAKIIDIAFELEKGQAPAQPDVATAYDKWYYPYLFTGAVYIDSYMTPHKTEATAVYENNYGFLPDEPVLRCHAAGTFAEIYKEITKELLEYPKGVVVNREFCDRFKDEEFLPLTDSASELYFKTTGLAKNIWPALQYGLMSGDPNGYFRPYGYLTRAEVLTILDRIGVSEIPIVFGDDGLIEKAKEKIRLDEKYLEELTISGKHINGSRLLVWFKTGSPSKDHIPLEFTVLGNETYRYERVYNPEISSVVSKLPYGIIRHIWFTPWLNNGVSVLVKDEHCSSMSIKHGGKEEKVAVDTLPFAYNLMHESGTYDIFFFDKDGKMLDYTFSFVFSEPQNGRYSIAEVISKNTEDSEDLYRLHANRYTSNKRRELEEGLNMNAETEADTVDLTNYRIDDLIYITDIDGYKLFRYYPSYVADNDENMKKLAAGAWVQTHDGWWADRSPKYMVFTDDAQKADGRYVLYTGEGGSEVVGLVGVFRCEFTPDGNSEMFYEDFNRFLTAHEERYRANLIARMKNVTADDIKRIDSTFDNIEAGDLAEALNNASDSYFERTESLRVYYRIDSAYLTQKNAGGFGGDDEFFIIEAGLEENIVQVHYYDGNGSRQRGLFDDQALYELIRGNYASDGEIDKEAYEPYKETIEARAQKTVDEELNMKGEKAYTGYEIVDFIKLDTFELPEYKYDVYKWNVVFTTDAPDAVVWAGGMCLDSEARVRSVDGYTHFVVKTDKNGNEERRFLFWSLYQGPDEETGRENAKQRIEAEFAK